MKDKTRERFINTEIWVRGLYMLLFLIAYNIAEFIIVLLAVFQFISALFTGRANEALIQFGKNLSVFVYEIFEFLTFNTDERPFPFNPWPDEDPGGDDWLQDPMDDELEAEQASTDTESVIIDVDASESDDSDPSDVGKQ